MSVLFIKQVPQSAELSSCHLRCTLLVEREVRLSPCAQTKRLMADYADLSRIKDCCFNVCVLLDFFKTVCQMRCGGTVYTPTHVTKFTHDQTTAKMSDLARVPHICFISLLRENVRQTEEMWMQTWCTEVIQFRNPNCQAASCNHTNPINISQ